ncbi:MAG: 5-(carboxyamino)imidazole ribonucleotide synthase [Bdellovibrionales bacterium]|jgi:5-(carboxyamino)imidazole ribonucleotide synthase|nr:5-(carboxyamino)imidazole ribonucleotide synthase [Bdellovibrionales bacterium]
MKPIGILGGGQLARMLVLEAHRLNLPVAVLSPSTEDPAHAVSGTAVQGDPNSLKALETFMSRCSVVTFESEFYDAAAIEQASRKTAVPVWPNPNLMARLQDRLPQKRLFDEFKIPTAPWFDVDRHPREILNALGGKAVFKKRRGGYDGYGTFVVRSEKDLATLPDTIEKKQEFIAEKLISFRREIALIAVRDRRGQCFFFPFVESKQENSRCLWVKGPLKETAAFIQMKRKIARFLGKTGYVGAMGIEMFETKTGELLVNEIAPRVHNTGHYTMDAFTLNQFSLHLRAVAGLPVSSRSVRYRQVLSKTTHSKTSFAMWNLLGSNSKPKSHTTALSPWKARTLSPEAELHWYGKTEARPGRKMGHVNAIAKTPEKALALARKAARSLVKDIGF